MSVTHLPCEAFHSGAGNTLAARKYSGLPSRRLFEGSIQQDAALRRPQLCRHPSPGPNFGKEAQGLAPAVRVGLFGRLADFPPLIVARRFCRQTKRGKLGLLPLIEAERLIFSGEIW